MVDMDRTDEDRAERRRGDPAYEIAKGVERYVRGDITRGDLESSVRAALKEHAESVRRWIT